MTITITREMIAAGEAAAARPLPHHTLCAIFLAMTEVHRRQTLEIARERFPNLYQDGPRSGPKGDAPELAETIDELYSK
jgi:hypothetical protein